MWLMLVKIGSRQTTQPLRSPDESRFFATFRAGVQHLLGRRHDAATNARGSEISGDFTGASGSHRSIDIAKSIQAWAHLMYGVRMVQKRRTR